MKQTIANTQELFAKKKTRAKRCVDVLLSNIQPQQKTLSNWMEAQNPATSLGFCETKHPGWKPKIQREALGFVKQVYPIQR